MIGRLVIAGKTIGVCIGASAFVIGLVGCPDSSDDGSAAGPSSTSNGAGGGGGEAGAAAGGGDDGLAITHTGLVSVQDMAIHGFPEVGHGLTVQLGFSEARAPDYEEQPGLPTGCKGWVYDVESAPQPPATDQGTIAIHIGEVSFDCRFDPATGYTCPVWSASGAAAISPGASGTASFTAEGASFSADDVGRYLTIQGEGAGPNLGAFPIVAVSSQSTAVVFHPEAVEEELTASYTVMAGAGPVPDNPVEPMGPDVEVTVGITPGGEGDFDFPDAGPITPGQAFVVDDATAALLPAIPLDGGSIALGCAGAGGSCGKAVLTVVRITTTDGETDGLSPFAMPEPVAKKVDLLCASLGDAPLVVPAEAMALLAEVHQASPVTRIRTAFMREGYALVQNPDGLPANPVRVLAGHGLLGFTTP